MKFRYAFPVLCRAARLWPVMVALAATAAEPAAVRFDFESGDLQGWRVVEGDFDQLVSNRATFHHGTVPYNKQGTFHLTTLDTGAGTPDDAFTGVVESPVFILRGPAVSFLVGGGRHASTYVALCTLDGAEVLRAGGDNAQEMKRIRWDAAAWVGRPVFLRVADRHTGGWGHITFDDFQADGELQPEATRRRWAELAARTLPVAPVRAAISDLTATFGARYPRGPEFLKQAEALEQALHGEDAAAAEKARADLAALAREALLANPLLSGQPLLFVARRQYRFDHHNTETVFQTGEINTRMFAGGGALKTLDVRTGTVTTLWESKTGIVRDPDVHFDGKKLLVAIRRDLQDDYHVYEMGADGSGLKQLTSAPGVFDIDPIYLPDDTVVFTSSREPKYCMCNRHIMGNLHRMEADGANIHQIGKSTLFEGHPTLMPDGRILYDRWEYVDRNFGDAQALWTVNPDGTNHALYWGNNTGSPGAVLEGRVIPGTDQVLCTFSSCHDRPWGALAIIDRRRGLDGRAPVVRTWPASAVEWVDAAGDFDTFTKVRPKYEDPYPLSEKYFLCARMTGRGEQMGIYLLDVFGNETLVHVEGEGCFDPMPLGPRPRPAPVPLRRDYENREGYFYVTDVYQGTHMEGVARGSVKYLRVVESPEKRYWSPAGWNGQGQEAPAMGWHDFNNKRILGTVPVAADGSASFAVPCDTYVYFQLLDEHGQMVQSMRSGTMVQSGEWAGCVGCHDERRAAPPRTTTPLPLALRQAPRKLEGWYGPPRLFNYLAEVQPVFDRNCAACHDFGGEGAGKVVLARDRDQVFNASYVELWRRKLIRPIGAGPAAIQQPRTWGSHASKLVAVLRGGHPEKALSAEDFDRIVTWIDINGPYYPSYASAHPDRVGGRSPLDDAALNRLQELTGAPLKGWADQARNPAPQISFDRPEKSPCLAVFKGNAEDPKYREALDIIRRGRDALLRRPNPDVEGFEPCEADRKREEKYQERRAVESAVRAAIREGRKVFDGTDGHGPTRTGTD